MSAYVYMVRCADGSFYTGWSSDPVRRAKVHNSGRGAKYTRSRLPVELVYTKECSCREDDHCLIACSYSLSDVFVCVCFALLLYSVAELDLGILVLIGVDLGFAVE